MDDKSLDRQEEDVPEEKKINENINRNHENAGPSAFLPGAIHSPRPTPGLSKSEHSIRQITTQDVTNALKSLSFGTPTQVIKNINMKDLKIPVLKDHENESTTLLDIKKFMASCFKQNKDNPVVLNDIPLQSVHTARVPSDIQELPNMSCNAQTECLPVVMAANEVIVTSIQPKLSKDKKKTSGSLSERSDIAVGQRDSLSSIGSNVCRICMTRGRERLISPCNCKGSLANVHLSCLERWLNQVGRNHCELCGFSYPAIRTPRYTVLQALRLWFGNPRNRSHLQTFALPFAWTELLPSICLRQRRRQCVFTQHGQRERQREWTWKWPVFILALPKSLLMSLYISTDINWSDCLIFWLLSTVTAGLLAVCIVGTQYFVIEGNKFGKLDAGSRKGEGISHRITETAMDFFMAIVLCGYSVTVYLLWKDHYVMWNRWRRANVNVRLLLAPDANPVPFTPRPRYNVV